MPIYVTCSCGKQLKARDDFGGKRAKCPACGLVVRVPNPEDLAADELLKETAERSAPPTPAGFAMSEGAYSMTDAPAPGPKPRPEPAKPTAWSAPKAVPPPAKQPARSVPPSSSNHHLCWLLVFALIPLGFSLAREESSQESTKRRFVETLQNAPPEVQTKVAHLLQAKNTTLTALLTALPDERIVGADLGRNSGMHWLYALAAAVLFLAFTLLLAGPDEAPGLILGVSLFTATIGILLLFMVQFFANWTQGVWITGRGIIVIIFYIAKFIGFSYRSALDPNSNFFISLVGFTFGVGLCEELCKALPLLVHFRRRPTLTLGGALVWGLASGAGFGVAEGIMYAGDQYNGIAPFESYLVRFISCVALHAIWCGSVAITLHHSRRLVHESRHRTEYALGVLRVLAVAMVLHGLYDTLLKKDLPLPALITALASFAWLMWQILRTAGQEEATTAPALARA